MQRLALSAVAALVLAAPAAAEPPRVGLYAEADVSVAAGPGISRDEIISGPAGDVNGDGRPDLLVADLFSGKGVKILYGGALTPHVPFDFDAGQGFAITATRHDDYVGASAGAAGDVNGDGYDDVYVGSPGHRSHGEASGRFSVVYGSPAPHDVNLDELTPAQGFSLFGAHPGNFLGYRGAGGVDLDDDGYDDVVADASQDAPGGGQASVLYVLWGGPARADVDAQDFRARDGMRIDAPAALAETGALVGVPDDDGDGFDDLAVGFPGASPGGRLHAGTVLVLRGGERRARVDLAAPAPSRIATIDGPADNAFVGGNRAFTPVGDVDGDGHGDFGLHAFQPASGARVLLGPLPDAVDLATPPARSYAITDVLGSNYDAVTPSGDPNGDGLADLMVSTRRGAVLVYGRQTPADLELSTATAEDAIAFSGDPGASPGDVDGDGRDDLTLPFGEDLCVVFARVLPRADYAEQVAAVQGEPTRIAPEHYHARTSRTVSIEPALPAGLTLDTATGVISGTSDVVGASDHLVTIRDDRGVGRSRLRIVIERPTPVNGEDGAAGADGRDGTTGANGEDGTRGAAGGAGATGATGSAGSAGAPGAPGAAGADALVTLPPVVTRPAVACALKRGRPRCRVVSVGSPAPASLAVTLVRGPRTFASGTATAAGPFAMNAPARLKAGRYRLRVRALGADGAPLSSTVRPVRL